MKSPLSLRCVRGWLNRREYRHTCEDWREFVRDTWHVRRLARQRGLGFSRLCGLARAMHTTSVLA